MAGRKGNGDAGNLTTRILVQIRDEMRSNRDEVKKTNERLDAVREELSERLERLERRQTEDSVRLATELVAVAKAVGEVRDLLKDRRAEREAISDHERRIRALEKRSA